MAGRGPEYWDMEGSTGANSLFPLDPSLGPLLMFDDHRATGDDTISLYSISKGQLLQARRADGFRGHRYWLTSQGWVLMLHLESRDTFLWNPSTLERVSLHPDEDNLLDQGTRSRCVLSHKPTDPDCVVLVLELTGKAIYYCRAHAASRGNQLLQWYKHEDASLTPYFTTLGGKFCAYDSTTAILRIATLQFSPDPTWETRQLLGHPTPIGYNCWDCSILERRGELFMVHFCHPVNSGRHVIRTAVHRLDFSAGAWLKVDTLGDTTVFLVDNTRSYGASLDARQVGLTKGDCICFLTREDKALYVYHMERGTTSMCNPGPSLEDSHVPQFFMPPV